MSSDHFVDDRALMLRVRAGDLDAFEEIYDRYADAAFGLALRVTGRTRSAEEVTQDAFLSLWRAARSYDRARGSVRTWLLTMVRNRSIDAIRHEAPHERNLGIDDVLIERLPSADSVEDDVADREEARYARSLLAGLPGEQREVIELAYFRGLTQAEIAARIEVPLGTVKGRQRLALEKMYRSLVGRPPALADGSPSPAALGREPLRR
ncbi:MAG: sigma-70 family RNA polymerase sigma factor [Solirubrobacteraceae bacterium]|jgi:RNA polymerase sigma-70 factor (ECF subfamily)